MVEAVLVAVAALGMIAATITVVGIHTKTNVRREIEHATLVAGQRRLWERLLFTPEHRLKREVEAEADIRAVKGEDDPFATTPAEQRLNAYLDDMWALQIQATNDWIRETDAILEPFNPVLVPAEDEDAVEVHQWGSTVPVRTLKGCGHHQRSICACRIYA